MPHKWGSYSIVCSCKFIRLTLKFHTIKYIICLREIQGGKLKAQAYKPGSVPAPFIYSKTKHII